MLSTQSPTIELCQAQAVRTFCVLLVIQAVVSYRSVPRILTLFKTLPDSHFDWVPHFTSVINWTLRLGLGLLWQVAPIEAPWLAIIDHSIDIGTKKALVVLRVPLATLALKGSAIQLVDCECIGLTVCEQVNGERIAQDLQGIFTQAGTPKAIIKDGDYTLQKGVRLWAQQQALDIPVIADIGHSMATALKHQFEKTDAYQRFTALTSQGAKRLRQTDLAFLIPPKLRSKGRFQSISTLGRWADNILAVFAVPGRAPKGSVLARLRTALPGFLRLKPFIKRFADTAAVVSQVLEILKNKGLDANRHAHCHHLAQTLPKHGIVKKHLVRWLDEHLLIQQKLTALPLLVSSDIIESLFGNFKHIIERSPQADMNRTTLLIPALCGQRDAATVERALLRARHIDLADWEKDNISYTLRKKRLAFFDETSSQKPGLT